VTLLCPSPAPPSPARASGLQLQLWLDGALAVAALPSAAAVPGAACSYGAQFGLGQQTAGALSALMPGFASPGVLLWRRPDRNCPRARERRKTAVTCSLLLAQPSCGWILEPLLGPGVASVAGPARVSFSWKSSRSPPGLEPLGSCITLTAPAMADRIAGSPCFLVP